MEKNVPASAQSIVMIRSAVTLMEHAFLVRMVFMEINVYLGVLEDVKTRSALRQVVTVCPVTVECMVQSA